MAKTKISEYDATAANNTDIDSINIAEGMAPSNVNNAIRELMAHLKDGLGAGTPVYLDATNNRLGVGTTAPAAALQVSDTSNDLQARFGNLTAGLDPSIRFQGKNVADTNNRYADIQLNANDGIFTIYAPAGSSPSIQAINIDTSGNVGVGTSSPSGKLHVNVGTTTSNFAGVVIEGTNSGSASAPDLTLYKNSSAPADDDSVGGIWFYGNNSAAEQTLYAGILGYSSDVTDGTEDGYLKFVVTGGGSAAQEAMRIDSSGRVGIGTSSPKTELNIAANNSGQGAKLTIENTDTSLTTNDTIGQIDFYANDASTNGTGAKVNIKAIATSTAGTITALTFGTADSASATATERMRIDGSGHLRVGTTDDAGTHVFSKGNSGNSQIVHYLVNPYSSVVGTGAQLFLSGTNTGGNRGSFIEAQVADTGNGHHLIFGTNAAGSSPVEVARFNSNGNYGVGQSSNLGSVNSSTNGAVLGKQGYGMFQRSSATVGYFNRNTSDGLLIAFYGTGTQEGTISISGTTVSYNGGHLSRWSQLSDNTKDTSIVKGTVMTNLDQMAVWTHAAKEVGDDILDVDGNVVGQETEAQAAYNEENEQLNCMAVSSIEGDPNVAGVFVNWDDDDDIFTNDMNIAMTGDMVIRIAQGTTVARGDLLMSAGDGTAKPQGDDIVRSKTIAKVTSTNVSHTYDDGSYLVPCVLMAC